MSAPVVLIAARERLESLRKRVAPAGDVLAFTESEVPRAIESVSAQTPSQFILERFFAATPRGVALISRLRTDPALADLEIRVVAHDSDYSHVVAHLASSASAPPENTPADDTAALIDSGGTRRAERVATPGGVEVQIDGRPVVLVDFSEGGAQVISPAVLRPNQRVRLSIAWQHDVARVGATVTWANFEMSKDAGRPQYRAGLKFNPGEADVIEALADKWGA